MKNFYERYWQNSKYNELFDEYKEDFPYKWPVIKKLFPKEGKTILDFGCGNGTILNEIKKISPNSKFIGIDISESAINEAKKKNKDDKFFRVDDGGRFPLPDASVDFIFAGDVIEHVYDTEKMFDELYRVLRPKGKILITTPYFGLIKTLIVAVLYFDEVFDPKGPHIRYYSLNSLYALLQALGLTVQEHGFFGRFFPVSKGVYVLAEKKEKPYLITGGCGFVGRNLARRLLNQGRQVWIVDNLFTGKMPEDWLPKGYQKIERDNGMFEYVNGDSKVVFIQADLVEFLDKEIRLKDKSIFPKFSDVFHFASVVGGRELIENDPLLVAKDLAIDAYFFLWASRFKDKHERILYASSSAAYPIKLQNNNSVQSLSETDLVFESVIGIPDMTYGWSKVSGEFLSQTAAKKYGIHVACVRPFSGYGEDQEPVYPIPAIALRVAKKENPLTVWGTGKQGRDFVHIDDCIDAFFVILDNISDGSAANIGSGKLTTFLEVLNIMSKIANYSPKIVKLLDKPVGVKSRFGDPQKLKKMGWTPKISNLEGFTRVFNYAIEKRT